MANSSGLIKLQDLPPVSSSNQSGNDNQGTQPPVSSSDQSGNDNQGTQPPIIRLQNLPSSDGTTASGAPAVATPSGPLSNAPEDETSDLSGIGKNIATSGIKGVAGIPGMFGDLPQLRDYLGARLYSAITGGKPEDAISALNEWRQEHPIASRLIDPFHGSMTTEDIAKPILQKTGEYHPTTTAGRLGAAGVQAATTGALTAGLGEIGAGASAGESALGIAGSALSSGAKAVPGAIVAGGGGEAATELTGDPLAGLIVGATLPAAGRFVKPAASYLEPIGASVSSETALNQAAERLQGLTQSPEKAIADLRFQPAESHSTTAQLTADPGIAAAQNAMETASPEFKARIQNIAGEQNVAHRETLAGMAPAEADILEPAKIIQQRVAATEAASDAYVAQLKQQADQLSANLPAGTSPEDVGAALRNAIAQENIKSRDAVTEAYKAVPDDLSADVGSIKKTADAIANGIGKYDKPLSSNLTDENGVLTLARNMPDQLTFGNLRSFDSNLTQELRSAKIDPSRANEYRLLSQLKKSTLDSINNVVGSAPLNAAKALYGERQATYGKGAVPEILKTYGGAEDYKTLSSAIPDKVFRGDNTGYQTAQSFLKAANNQPVAIAALQDMANNSLRKAMGTSGTLNQKALDTWKAKFKEPLRALDEVSPGYSSRFDDIAKATDALSEAQSNVAKSRSNALIEPVKSLFGASSEDSVISTVGSMIKNKNGVGQINEAIQAAGNDPNAIAGLRRAGARWLLNETATAGVAGGVPVVSGAKLRSLLDQHPQSIETLFGPEAMNNLRLMAEDAKRAQAVYSLQKVGVGSDTAAKIIRAFGDSAGKYADKGISGLMFLTALEGLHSGSLTHALFGGALAGGKALVDSFRQKGISRVNDLVEEAVVNPSVARDLLERAKSNKSADIDKQLSRLSRTMTRTAIVAGQQGAKVGSDQSKEASPPAINRATGGKVGDGASKLMRLAEHAKRAETGQTESILKVPDEAVVKALDVAKQAI